MNRLKESKALSEQTWEEDTIPLVSIQCITYNHEEYIKDAIEGFLIQETNFPVEILIHDDASTDRTADIIREYELKYPHLFKPIYQKENQYSKKKGVITRIQNERVKGKYIAKCEGDDYWTDPLKLQKQVDFMEENLEYVACGCYVDIERYGNLEKLNPPYEEESANYLDFIHKGIFPTLTILFRKVDFTPYSTFKPIVGDIELFMYLSQFGDFKKLAFNGAVYRYHGKGANSGKDYYTNRKNNILAKLNFNQQFKLYPNNLFKKSLKRIIKDQTVGLLKNLVRGRKIEKQHLDFIKFCIHKYKSL